MKMKTRTKTNTLTRHAALVYQYEYALLKLADRGREQFEKVVEPGLRKGLLRGVLFSAELTDGEPAYQLRLTVDWGAHSRAAVLNGPFVTPDCWKGDVSDLVRRAVQIYRELTRQHQLRVKVTLFFDPAAVVEMPELAKLPRRDASKRDSGQWETRTADGLGELTVEMCGYPPEGSEAAETSASIETRK